MYFRSRKSMPLWVLMGLAPVLLSACGTQKSAAGSVKTSPAVKQSADKTVPAKARAGTPVPPLSLLTLAARIQAAQPVHMNTTITDTLGNAHVQMTSAVDPINKEAESTEHATLSGISGANAVTVVGQSIRIGQHSWGQSTPPGGGWHEETVQPTNPFPIGELFPYIVNVHPVSGQLVRGHETQGVSATLDKQGVRLLESLSAGKSVSPAQQIITSMVFTLWIGPEHHPRKLHLTEHCVQDGRPYEVLETTIYFHWGQGLHLTGPTVAN